MYDVAVWEQASVECLKCGFSTLKCSNACKSTIQLERPDIICRLPTSCRPENTVG